MKERTDQQPKKEVKKFNTATGKKLDPKNLGQMSEEDWKKDAEWLRLYSAIDTTHLGS